MSTCLPPVRSGEALPGPAEAAVRDLFPDAAVVGVEAETDEGLTLYVVRIQRGGLTTDVEVSAEGILCEVETELGIGDVPEHVAAAIREATLGGKLVLLEQHELHGRIRDGGVAALPEPQTVYEVRFQLEGKNRVVEIADTPALKLPQPARAAVEEAFPDAVIRKVSAEREAGLPLYEAELVSDGKRLEVEVSPEGTIASVASAAGPDDVPAAVGAAVARAAGGAEIVGFEREEVRAVPRLVPLDRPRVLYEAEFHKDGRRYEVTVAADGTVVSVEEDDDGHEPDQQ
jgi:uncharacterized membrane protein YkoI